jgi:hypothetical protein
MRRNQNLSSPSPAMLDKPSLESLKPPTEGSSSIIFTLNQNLGKGVWQFGLFIVT